MAWSSIQYLPQTIDKNPPRLQYAINHSYTRARHRARLRLRNLRVTHRIYLANVKNLIAFYIPESYNCTLFRLKKSHMMLYLFSNVYFVHIPIHPNARFSNYDGEARVIGFYCASASGIQSLYDKFLSLFLISMVQKFFIKIKFKGKGYRLMKSRQRRTLVYQFGHSHQILEYTYPVTLRSIAKYAIIIFGSNYFDLKRISFNIRRWRPINIYTGRGLRFHRQIIYRKQGKLKTYK